LPIFGRLKAAEAETPKTHFMNSFFKELTSTVVKDLLPVGNELSYPINPGEYTTPDNALWTFDNIGGSYNYFRYTGFGSCVDAYNRCPIVSAIINQQAQAFVNGKTKFYDEDGNEVKDGKTIDKVRTLLRKPNPLQSQIAFEAQIYVYLKLFGFAIVLPVKPAGFTKKYDASSLWCIPPNWLDWSASNERFDKYGGTGLKEIVVTYNGTSTIFQIDDLIFIKDFTPQLITAGNALTFPQSKVFSNEMFINNIIGALESRNMLINYRGALGILSQDAGKGQFVPLAITPDQKEDLQKDFKRYGLRRNQFQVILTGASLKWQQMGYPTKELMLMEEVEQSSIGICASWNFPPFILGFKDATFHNMNEAEKHLYENCTKPDADNIYGTFGEAFGLIDQGIFLRKDYSHVAPLQEDKLDAAAARLALNKALEAEWRNGKLTLNEWADRLGEQPIQAKDGRGDLYFPEYVAKYGDPGAKATLLPPSEPNANDPAKMFRRSLQTRDAQGRYTALYNYIFDNTTPNGQEI
jgi:phage portal protein BeeE